MASKATFTAGFTADEVRYLHRALVLGFQTWPNQRVTNSVHRKLQKLYIKTGEDKPILEQRGAKANGSKAGGKSYL